MLNNGLSGSIARQHADDMLSVTTLCTRRAEMTTYGTKPSEGFGGRHGGVPILKIYRL